MARPYDTNAHLQAQRDLSSVPRDAALAHLDDAERDLLEQALLAAATAAGTVRSLTEEAQRRFIKAFAARSGL